MMESVETKYIVILMALCTSFMLFVGIVELTEAHSDNGHQQETVETSGIMG